MLQVLGAGGMGVGVARLAEGSRLGEVPDGPNTAQESRYMPSVIHKAILAAVSVG